MRATSTAVVLTLSRRREGALEDAGRDAALRHACLGRVVDDELVEAGLLPAADDVREGVLGPPGRLRDERVSDQDRPTNGPTGLRAQLVEPGHVIARQPQRLLRAESVPAEGVPAVGGLRRRAEDRGATPCDRERYRVLRLEPIVGEQLHQPFHPWAEQLGALLWCPWGRLRELVVDVVCTRADAQLQPTARDLRHRERRAGENRRVPERHRRDERADPRPSRDVRERAQAAPRLEPG